MKAPKIINRRYKSGFEANLILRPGYNQRFFGIIIDFGSSDPQKVAGTAHFLEHKLFAKKDGDISNKFEEIGANVNAFTSFNETMFYCSTIKNSNKILNLLFRLVAEPYFTKVNVNKEVPIIQQELAMYQDQADWAVGNAIMQEMFASSNLGLDVAGTQKSIAAIDVSTLESAYNNYYLPDNMKFVACGDFSKYQIKKLFSQVNKLQNKYFKNTKVNISKKLQLSIGKMSDLIIPSNTSSNIFGLGIRLTNFKKVLSSLDLAQIIIEIMLESKLSVTNSWFEKMRKQNWLNNSLQIVVNYTRQGNFATIFGISEYQSEIIKAIKKELNRPLNQNDWSYTENFFELKKRELLAQYIRNQNDISDLAIEVAEESLNHEKGFETLSKLLTMSFKDFLSYYSDLMKEARICSAFLQREE